MRTVKAINNLENITAYAKVMTSTDALWWCEKWFCATYVAQSQRSSGLGDPFSVRGPGFGLGVGTRHESGLIQVRTPSEGRIQRCSAIHTTKKRSKRSKSVMGSPSVVLEAHKL